MSLWKKTMDYLGLGPDDAYDEYDDVDEYDDRPQRAQRAPESRAPRATPDEADVRPAPRPSFPSRDFDASQRRSPQQTEEPTVNVRGGSRRRCVCEQRTSKRSIVGVVGESRRAVHGATSTLRPSAGTSRQVQRGLAGDHEPRGHRTRGLAAADRLRQWDLLRPRRLDGEGRHRRVPTQASARACPPGRLRLRLNLWSSTREQVARLACRVRRLRFALASHPARALGHLGPELRLASKSLVSPAELAASASLRRLTQLVRSDTSGRRFDWRASRSSRLPSSPPPLRFGVSPRSCRRTRRAASTRLVLGGVR